MRFNTSLYLYVDQQLTIVVFVYTIMIVVTTFLIGCEIALVYDYFCNLHTGFNDWLITNTQSQLHTNNKIMVHIEQRWAVTKNIFLTNSLNEQPAENTPLQFPSFQGFDYYVFTSNLIINVTIFLIFTCSSNTLSLYTYRFSKNKVCDTKDTSVSSLVNNLYVY